MSSDLMVLALQQARLALNLSSPNPRVGCVLTDAGGRVIGMGHTQHAGGPHAEVMALRDAQAKGESTVGATAYVTLEPCSHHGRTGPCCDALIAAGISRVIAATLDPNPLVAGNGIARLRAAGIEVEVGPCAADARELNIGFFSRMLRKRPWVRMKAAASLDGKTALDDGTSQWITSEAARRDGHAWRARACAVLTGIGTVLQDDPRLDVRDVQTQRQPSAIVVDSRLETPEEARIFSTERDVLVYSAVQNDLKRSLLERSGAEVISLPTVHGKVDLSAMMTDLAGREINELHVEAGHKLNGSLLQGGLVDELLLYIAPRFLGPGQEIAQFAPLKSLDESLRFEFLSVEQIGIDLRILARIPGHDRF